MPETLHPGIYLNEKGGQPLVQGAGVSTGSVVGTFEKGPIDRAMVAFSWDDVLRQAGDVYKSSYAGISAYLFFRNGGSRLYLSRVLGTGHAVATTKLKSLNNSDDAADVNASSPGAWGDNVAVRTAKYTTTIAEALTTGSTTVELTSVQNVELGDRVVISDGTTSVIVTVLGINLTTSEISFKAITLGATIPSGSWVGCSSTHRTNTTLTADLDNGATSANLADAGSLRIGSVVTFASTADEIDVVVTAVNGNSIQFSAITLGSTIVSGSIAVSQEFDLLVYEGGQVAEGLHRYLSMESTNEVDYIEVRLFGDSSQSSAVEMEIDTPGGTYVGHKIPYPVTNSALSGGADGATPQDSDYMGSSVLGNESGLHLFDRIDDINLVCIPGVTSVVVESYLIDWCIDRHAKADPVFPLLDIPFASNTALEARNFKQVQLNRDTSHGALFYPWLKFPSRTSPNTILDIPPSGPCMGVYSRVAANKGVHKAPANEEIRGIVGLEHKTSAPEQDLLNPIGVNVIRSFAGRGIRIYGARTLTTFQDGRHYVHKRLTLNFIEESLTEALAPYVFDLHHDDTWDEMRLTAQLFLTNMWREGALQPRDDRSRAFFVKVDETNNPQSERDAGRLNIEVGVNIVGTAEFIIFTAGLWDGGALIEEVA